MSKLPGPGPFPWRVHPIWRGIGCLLLVIVPIIALGITDWLLTLFEEPLPSQLTQTLVIPGLGSFENAYGRILLTIFFSFVLFLLFSIVGSLFYSLLGGQEDEDLAEFTRRRPRG